MWQLRVFAVAEAALEAALSVVADSGAPAAAKAREHLAALQHSAVVQAVLPQPQVLFAAHCRPSEDSKAYTCLRRCVLLKRLAELKHGTH